MADSGIYIMGHLTRDPEFRTTEGGVSKCSFPVAVTRKWTNQRTQQHETHTSFIHVVCWRETAENCVESLKKSDRVVVVGRLEHRTWEQDGEPRSTVEVIADEVGASLRWATVDITRNDRRSQ